MVFQSELAFEQALIQRLTESGWVNHRTREPEILRYKTEKELIQNWADILFENNNRRDRLNDAPLTEGEMQQILEQIKALRTPVRLNGFINGKSVIIKRDNPDDALHFGHEVSLTIYDRLQIGGGNSRYQIAEQPRFSTKSRLLPDRRGDFMLLINGMPVIHVELKKSGIPVSQAYYQIEKYAHEGVFTGLFSLVQVFVAMEPNETVYFANPGPDGKFNTDYYFHWADANNEPINDWEEIARKLLSIPMAHEMIGFYTVADNTDNTLKVMRSYQYYAAAAISNAVAQRKWPDPKQRGGYIWHTTGSGKTMTSFKSAQLIASSGDADKVVFLMDRIELGTQSLREYRGFADDSDSVQATENTGVLVTKLKSDDPANTLIVTSIQKMSRITEEDGYKGKDIERINRKRLVFIVDECHRDTFGEMMSTIKDTFPNAMFFGFTGTPIHDENKKKLNTTTDVFGDELHRYSIADGIRDKNVLGFHPTMVTTYNENELREEIVKERAKVKDISEVFSDSKKEAVYNHYMNDVPMAGYEDDSGKYVHGIEDELPNAQYDRDEHRMAVVEDIRRNWIRLSRNGKFHAILATSSIPEAIKYYGLFDSKAPELKVTVLVDPNIDNNPGAVFKEDGLVKTLEDYNKVYGVEFSLKKYGSFKKDVALRLAHKKPYIGIEREREKQIDILIVVDQMLTGFDSKWVNTLYLDKVLRYESLIQAFSRTNRLFNPGEKPFGNVRWYRKPYTMHRNVEKAFELYSGNKPYGIFVSKLGENLKKMNEVYADIVSLFEAAGVTEFETLPENPAAKGRFAKLFRQFNLYLESAVIQGFTWDKLEYKKDKDNGISETIVVEIDENTFLSLALRYKELFAGSGNGGNGTGGNDVPYDIDPHLTEINTGSIDHKYMEARFQKYLKDLQDGVESTAALKELRKSFGILTQEQQKYAHIFLMNVQQGNLVVDENKTLIDYINQYQAEAHHDQIHRFAAALGVDEGMLRTFMSRDVNSGNLNEYGLFDQLKASVDKAKAKTFFEKLEGKPLKAFRVPAKVDTILRKFILSGGFDVDEF